MNTNVNEVWITSDKLESFVSESKRLKPRYKFSELMMYLKSNTSNICAIYGLRRTGKTILMKQAIRELVNDGESADAIAYITFGKSTEYSDLHLLNDINDLVNKGIKYVFIDEISYINMDLEDNSLNKLSDVYCCNGIKIVVAGTFSYAIKLLSEDVLYDRVTRIDTTFFSFKEAHEVLGITLDEFIQFGGIMFNQSDNKTPREYMQTAVVDNIVTSVIRSNKLYDIGYLDEKTDGFIEKNDIKRLKHRLSTLVKIVIDQYMKVLIYNKITGRPYKFSDIGNLADIIRQRSNKEHKIDEALSEIRIDKRKYYEILQSALGTIEKEKLNSKIFKEFIDILKQIGVIEDIYLQGTSLSCVVTSYLRYGLCDEIVSVIEDAIQEETGHRYSAYLANEVLKGNMLETIIFLDLKHSNKYDFDKFTNAESNKEIDLIIKDHNAKALDLYEIKHSSEQVGVQAKHLLDEELKLEIERVTGYKIRSLNVIYNGLPCEKQINAIQMYQQLKEKADASGETNLALKYDRIIQTATVQNWQTQTIHYINATEFLLKI